MVHHVSTVFVDMLGFSNLVLEDHGVVPLLRPSTATSFRGMDEDLASMNEGHHTRLETWFATFHGVLNILVARNAPATGLAAVSFSDSAFVAFEHSNMALLFAREMMRALLSRGVPARAGIAYGSFLGLRYLTDISPPATSIHQSQFLGTSVVLAHHAEACGVKGFRILLDPHLPVPSDCREYVMALPDDERALAAKKGKSAVVDEVAYLLDYDEEREAEETSPGRLNTQIALHRAVKAMRKEAPEREHLHHDATTAALWRMRERLGLAYYIDPQAYSSVNG